MPMDIEKARVQGSAREDHPTLFPLSDYSHPPVSPENLCKRIRLNWMTALELHGEGWLSFDPQKTDTLNAEQEAELTLVGSLAAAGCDKGVLRHLLSGLRKPYAYRLDRLYYDWQVGSWRLLEDVDDFDERFDDWINELVGWNESERLERLRDRIESAILYMNTRRKTQAAS
ncbi:MAG: hypothetical protein HQ559_08635 [Lentisphaerae bacterium]|nr:hypothetical protein [Lentisphaerota bacterium]